MWKGKYSVRQSCRPSHSGAYSYKNDTHCKCAQNLKRRKNGNRSFSVVSNYWISHFFSFLLFVFSVLRCNHTIILHIWGIKPISSFILAPSRFFFFSLNVVMWALGLSMCSADFSDYCYPSFVYTLIQKMRSLPLLRYNFLQGLLRPQPTLVLFLPLSHTLLCNFLAYMASAKKKKSPTNNNTLLNVSIGINGVFSKLLDMQLMYNKI